MATERMVKMSALQIFMVLFGFAGLLTTAWAIWAIFESPDFQKKPLWMAGCIPSFVGLSINFTLPNDLYFWFGIQIPFFSITSFVGSGQWLVKLGFPIIPIIALAEIYIKKTEVP